MKNIMIAAAGSLFIAVWGIRYYTFNGSFIPHDRYEKREYGMGETVEINEDDFMYGGYFSPGYTITADSAKVYTCSEFLEKYGKSENDIFFKPEKFLEVSYTIENVSNDSDEDGIHFYSIPLSGSNWYDFYNDEATAFANDFFHDEPSAAEGVRVPKGKTSTVKVVYNLHENYMTSDQWENIENELLWISVSIRPEMRKIILKVG